MIVSAPFLGLNEQAKVQGQLESPEEYLRGGITPSIGSISKQESVIAINSQRLFACGFEGWHTEVVRTHLFSARNRPGQTRFPNPKAMVAGSRGLGSCRKRSGLNAIGSGYSSASCNYSDKSIVRLILDSLSNNLPWPIDLGS